MPSPSPTMTRAVKLKRRPPLTTLATRLIATTRSMYAVLSAAWPPRRSSRLPRRSPPAPVRRWDPLMFELPSLFQSRSWLLSRSEREATLAGAVGERGDAPVVLVAGAVEDHALDTGGLGALGDELTDLAGLGGLVALEGADVGLHCARVRQRATDQVVDDLHGDVLGRAGDDQARALRGPGDLLAAPDLAAQPRRDA